MLYFLGHSFFKLLFTGIFRLKIKGAENIPADGPALICANHQSFIDPPLVGSAVKRPVHYMARHDLFTVPVLGWLISRVKAFPVKRSGVGDPGAFKNIQRLLEGKEIVLLFPEGTRSRDGYLQKPLPGAGLIVYQAKDIPVIPCYVDGSREVLPRGSKFLHYHRLKVIFGKPIDFSAYYQKERSKDLYREMSARIMQEIANLKAQANDKN
ncbi:MAG: lysophospholipid acyltransferase family protein [bacterium]|nr:lysophospholipid acyltransferase family protein [bacterium]MDD5756295.1 lysophospholipid acyltransferase family protein [bacterium]